jgi:glycosyltransferase involved in cell wall biosynthesis
MPPSGDAEATGRTNLRLLAIGTDAELVKPAREAVGDAHQRQLKYASILADYEMIVRTLGGRRFSIRHGTGFVVHASGSRTRAAFPLDSYRLGLRRHRAAGFDLVSTEDPMLCGLGGYLLKRRLGLPLSVQLAGDMLDNRYWLAERRINPLLNLIGKWLVRRADSVRVVSLREREKLIRLGVAPERIWNLGWLTDVARLASADGRALRTELLPPPYDRLVLFVGRLVRQKDLPTLLRAAGLVLGRAPSTRFVLVGRGPEEVEARQLAAELHLGEGVVFVGSVPYARVPAYYAACDVLAASTRYEGNARVLAEAAAAGKPVVTADVSGARDTVVDGETGYIVPVGRADELARRLLRLLEDPAAAAAMGARAREHVARLYADDRLLAGFGDLWRYTAHQRGSVAAVRDPGSER